MLLIKTKQITYKDVVIFYFIEQKNFKSAIEISRLSGVNYARLLESLNRLLEQNLICKTDEARPKYYIKEELQ